MILDCILTSVNENETYIDFIPIFIMSWKKLYPNIDIKILLIANEIPDKFMSYKDYIILFKPIDNVLTSFTSQIIRIYYPAIMKYTNGIMITDIDMIPMNRTYYTEYIKEYDNSKFIYMRGNFNFNYKELAICYNVAVHSVWSEIMNIHSIEDVIEAIKSVSGSNTIKEGHGNTGWTLDQTTLYSRVMDWNNKTNNLVCVKDSVTKFKRLDRGTFRLNDDFKKQISSGVYSDYHCFRPMSKYTDINYEIYNLL